MWLKVNGDMQLVFLFDRFDRICWILTIQSHKGICKENKRDKAC